MGISNGNNPIREQAAVDFGKDYGNTWNVKYHYPTNKLNVYAIKDEEVNRLLEYYMDSINNLFNFHGNNYMKGIIDSSYAYYTHAYVELSRRIEENLPLDEERERYHNKGQVVAFQKLALARAFDPDVYENRPNSVSTEDLLAKHMKLLGEAEKEMLQIVADYMALKYENDPELMRSDDPDDRRVQIFFDKLYFEEAYPGKRGIDFSEENYLSWITPIFKATENSEKREDAFKLTASKVSNLQLVERKTLWMVDNETVETRSKVLWDIRDGRVLGRAEPPAQNGEKESLPMLRESEVVFLNEGEKEVFIAVDENGQEVAPPDFFVVLANIDYKNGITLEKRKELENAVSEDRGLGEKHEPEPSTGKKRGKALDGGGRGPSL